MTAPDFLVFLPLSDDNEAAVRNEADKLRNSGATSLRVTWFDDEHPSDVHQPGIYLEAWRDPPKEQPPFSFPPLTLNGLVREIGIMIDAALEDKRA